MHKYLCLHICPIRLEVPGLDVNVSVHLEFDPILPRVIAEFS